MLILTVILLVMVAERIAAACSMPARKLAGAAIAAASNTRLMVKPLEEVSATIEPTPPLPELLTAAMDSTDSSGRTGAMGVKASGGFEPPESPVPDAKDPNDGGPKPISLPPELVLLSSRSDRERVLIA